MVGFLLGGLLLEVATPRLLVAGCGAAGLLVVALVVPPVIRAIRAERAVADDRPAERTGSATPAKEAAEDAELATPVPSR
jgi:hypothetical protein